MNENDIEREAVSLLRVENLQNQGNLNGNTLSLKHTFIHSKPFVSLFSLFSNLKVNTAISVQYCTVQKNFFFKFRF